MTKYINILTFCLKFSLCLAQINNIDITQQFTESARELLSQLMQNSVNFNNLLDHGCWCSKFDQFSDSSIRGGNSVLDELDGLCKEWFQVRNCNDKYNGGSCFGLNTESFSYQVFDSGCNSVDANDANHEYNICEMDSCTIDLYYSIEIINHMNSNPSFGPSVIGLNGNSCSKNAYQIPVEKYCTGIAPDLVLMTGVLSTNAILTTQRIVTPTNTPATNIPTTTIPTTSTPTTTTTTTTAPTTTTTTEPTTTTTQATTIAIAAPTTTEIPSISEVVAACNAAKFDLTLLVDGSGSVKRGDFRRSVNFIQDIVDNLDISVNGTRVTIAQFSFVTTIYSTFAATKSEVDDAITTLRSDQNKRATFTSQALTEMHNNINLHGRNVPQVIIILTDGKATHGFDVNVSNDLHNNGVIVYALGVGHNLDEDELEDIASDPDSEFLYMIDNFKALENIKAGVTQAACTLDRSFFGFVFHDEQVKQIKGTRVLQPKGFTDDGENFEDM